MSGKNFLDDTQRFIHATLSNQIAKLSPTLYSRLTKQTGRGFTPESPLQVANYFLGCFNDYFETLGLPKHEIGSYLSGKHLLEYGPGDVPGVALLMIAHGAERVTCVDRFSLLTLTQKNLEILEELLGCLGNDARARAAQCFLQPGRPSSGFNPERIRYLIQPSGLSKLIDEIDLIFSRAALEHVNDLDATFEDMASALKSDGIILHQVDLKSHGLHRRNPLDFLTWPTVLWRWMHSHKGVPNRWRINAYRDALRQSGFEEILMTPIELVGQDVIDEIRPHLALPFKSLSNTDLSWLSFWLVCRKIGNSNLQAAKTET